jgi:hypothetical protein
MRHCITVIMVQYCVDPTVYLCDGVVRGEDGLHTLASGDAYAHMRCLDHGHVVGTIADGERCDLLSVGQIPSRLSELELDLLLGSERLRGLAVLHQLHHERLLHGRRSAANHSVALLS